MRDESEILAADTAPYDRGRWTTTAGAEAARLKIAA